MGFLGFYFFLKTYFFLILEDAGLKLRSFNKDHTGDLQRRNENNEPTYHQLGHGDDLRLNHSNYHVNSNPSNKDW